MARRATTGRKTSKAKARKAGPLKSSKVAKTKRPIRPASPNRDRPSVANLKRQLERHARESAELRQQQTATAEVLKVISRSAFDLDTVMNTLADSARTLCGSKTSNFFLRDGGMLVCRGSSAVKPEDDEFMKANPVELNDDSHMGRAVLNGTIANIGDFVNNPHTKLRKFQQAMGFKSFLAVPLMREGRGIGVFTLGRDELGPFSQRQVELVQGFANQAVIAIENARLFDEVQAKSRDLAEALQQQTTTANVLKVISRSAFDLDSVMNTLTQSAAELCKAEISALYLREGDVLVVRGVTDMHADKADFLRRTPLQVSSSTYVGRAVRSESILNIADVDAETDIGLLKEFGRVVGFKAILFVPLMREGRGIGVFALGRMRTGQFSQAEVALVQTFADQAVIAIENTRLFNETKEALERQTATAEVLQVISSSISDAKPVFERILESTKRLIVCENAGIFLAIDEQLHCAAMRGPDAAVVNTMYPRPLSQTSAPIVIALGRQVCYPDVANGPDVPASFREISAAIERNFSVALTPLLWEGRAIGTLNVSREAGLTFNDKELSLLRSFANQAVIAIQNARLFEEVQARTRDLQESLDQQTATSEVLESIGASAGELEPVFQTVLEKATRVCGASFGTLNLFAQERYETVALYNVPPAFAASRMGALITPHPEAGLSHVTRTKQIAHIHDLRHSPAYLDGSPAVVEFVEIAGARTVIIVPMLKENELVGTITIYKKEVRPFTEKQIDLIANFAKQAVIAIENTRLLKELRERTDDLSESLQQQTATADVLRVISDSPGSIEPVFDEILGSARRLCDAEFGHLLRFDGESWHAEALHNVPDAYANFWNSAPVIATPETNLGRVQRSGKPDQVADVRLASGYLARSPLGVATAELGGARTLLTVPLVKESKVIGGIALYRTEVRPFGAKQIELLSSFADHAVIAIENTRLFNETREALERQTATADILKVIASSPNNVQPVFQAIADRSKRLVDALSTTVFTLLGDMMHLKAFTPTNPEADAVLQAMFPTALFSFSWGEAVERGNIYRVVDTESELDKLRELARLRGFRSMLIVPLVRDRMPIGLISVTRVDPGPFADHHVQLLQTFADQAVIAIENVRMFDEVQARTREVQHSLKQQTAVGDVLKIISRSTFDLQPVLDTLVQTAAQLCEADMAFILRREEGRYRAGAAVGFSREYIQFLQSNPIAVDRGTITGRAVLARSAIQVADVAADPEYTMTESIRLAGQRTALGVPLLRENEPIGVIVLARQRVEAFTANQVEVVTTFADQAVIAMENVRLFEELKRRTDDLAEALDKQTATLEELRAAQNRLVQTEKLASLGQLTAGIAHEIKNPLNFINNFSAVSAELIDELDETLAPATLDQKQRGEVGELTQMLKSNLEKVVQHGKRADSIVRNMLLHSREGSGEHRSADINAIIEDSLNLAYHGARAERPGFDITLQRDLDPAAGEIELYPQEITRALLNLISNGFYAATKRAADAGNGFEPALKAATKSFGDRVEICIRDNGTGIPAGIKEKIFNPFFTTKPAGEGTGLGLSMSHDIVVKQHGGMIDVNTEPGAFTEFIITLPRKSARA